jgi:hypothetical protein
MSDPKFPLGTKVRVEIEGVVERTGRYGDPSKMMVRNAITGQAHYFDPDKDKISLLDPQYWPPRVGDTWAAEGHLYFAREYSAPENAGAVVVESFAANPGFSESYRLFFPDTLNDFKAMNPVLRFRPVVDPEKAA